MQDSKVTQSKSSLIFIPKQNLIKTQRDKIPEKKSN